MTCPRSPIRALPGRRLSRGRATHDGIIGSITESWAEAIAGWEELAALRMTSSSSLGPDEVLIASGSAQVPMPRHGFMTLFPIGTIIRPGYVVLDRKRSADLPAQTLNSGFPMVRFMGVALTSERLMTWRASRFPAEGKGFSVLRRRRASSRR